MTLDATRRPGRVPRLGRALTQIDPPPDVFAVVMATGVVSLAATDHGYRWIGISLGALAVTAFALLGLAFGVRALTQPGRVARLTRDPDVALRMFTFVAACTVLAARWPSESRLGWALGGLALGGWLVLTPLAGVDVLARRPDELRRHVHGAWLLPSVATQGLAISAATLAVRHRLVDLAVVAAAAWVLGLLIYVVVTWLIAWRALSAPLAPDTVTPDSWILMGSAAITALAGAHLLSVVRALHGTAEAANVASSAAFWPWVLATLWIPVLLYAEVWRADHVTGSLRYKGVWWSAVFPIGMYSVASSYLATMLGIRALRTVSLVFFWNALAPASSAKLRVPRWEPRGSFARDLGSTRGFVLTGRVAFDLGFQQLSG